MIHLAILFFSLVICVATLNLATYLSLVNFIEQHIRDKRIFAIAGNHDDHELMKQELRGSCIAVVDKAKLHGREVIFLNSSAKPLDKRHPLGSGRVDNLWFSSPN